MKKVSSNWANGRGLRKHKPRNNEKGSSSSSDKKVTSLYFTLLDKSDFFKQRLRIYKIDLVDNNSKKLELLFVSQRCQGFTLVTLASQIFCLGGNWYWTDDVHYPPESSTDVFSFDSTVVSHLPMEDRGWIAQPPMNFPRLCPRAVVLRNKVIVMDGIKDSNDLTNKYWAEIFDPQTNSWDNLSVAGSGDLSLFLSIMSSIRVEEEYRNCIQDLNLASNIAVYSASEILIAVGSRGLRATTFLFDIDSRSLRIKDVCMLARNCFDLYHPRQPLRVGESIYHISWANFCACTYNVNKDKYHQLPYGKAFVSEDDLFSFDSMEFRNCCALRVDDGIELSSRGVDELHVLWFARPSDGSGSEHRSLYYKNVRFFQDENFLQLLYTIPIVFECDISRGELLEGCCCKS